MFSGDYTNLFISDFNNLPDNTGDSPLHHSKQKRKPHCFYFTEINYSLVLGDSRVVIYTSTF
jgi:hypothetical protein